MAAKVVLISFADIHQLAGTHEDDVTDFSVAGAPVVWDDPPQAARLECTKALKRKREEQVLNKWGEWGG